MARAAFIADKFMRRIGLPGKAFIPLLVGFGCTVPAIMATRTLESPQRPCFCLAAHSIYELWCKAARIYIFGDDLLPASCRTGDLRFIFLWNCDGDAHGVALKKDHIQERAGNFVMELPPYHFPTFNGIMLHTWFRLKDFILRAGKTILHRDCGNQYPQRDPYPEYL